jgi:ABC-type uncharacterized transport system substrate-binding protein
VWYASIYVVRVLRAEKPAELPVMQPTKYELVMNLRTVKATGLEFASAMLAPADERRRYASPLGNPARPCVLSKPKP